jgi:hypothetical protein
MSVRATCDDCGYSGTYKTEALAAHHHGKHSCDRHRQREATAARVKARRTHPGTKRDCQHKQARHVHGTRQAYVLDRCTCIPCRTANREHEAARKRAKLYGRYDSGRVDAQPAREHLGRLIAGGVSLKRCAQLTGVSTATLGYILYGRTERNEPPRKRIERHVAEAVLAIQPRLELMAPGRRIPSTGTARRLQALATLGYSTSALGSMLGVARANMDTLMDPSREVTVKKALMVRALYDRLWCTPNNPEEWRAKIAASRARNAAAARGWAPPMAWDDETIDDPAATPQGVAKPTATREQWRDGLAPEVRHLLGSGMAVDVACAKLGMTRSALERALHRAGEHRLATWVHTGEQAAA